MEYCVAFVRYGFATVEANSEAEAYEAAYHMQADEISWSDDIEVSNCESEID